MSDRAASVDEVVELYRRWGAERYDEEVTQLDHACQTAALARRDGAADELVVAALLHDVGHLLDLRDREGDPTLPGRDLGHEGRGAAWLSDLFPPEVTRPIALHVRAKRYRCAVDPDYATGLSAGSTRSLALQGGPYDADQAAAFEARPGAADAVRLRRWDDGGKVDGLPVPGLDDHRARLDRLALR